jgi:DNA topoisomerase-6 subunit A
MAKKKPRRAVANKSPATNGSGAVRPKLNARDKKTMGDLVGVADRIVVDAEKKRDPYLDIPSRTLSNIKYSKANKILEMGKASNRRQLFNLSQAKIYMQSVLVASGSKRLIEQGKTTSLRGLYYMLKHTIEGTREETFDEQSQSDTVIEDMEVTLNAMREELHL